MQCNPLLLTFLRHARAVGLWGVGGWGAPLIVVAAPIAWAPASDTTAPTDVVTTGMLVEAVNAGAASGVATVNGVTFAASNELLPNSSGADFLDGQTTLDEAFDQLLGTLDYGGGTVTTLTVGDGKLTPGQAYRLQVFFTDLRGCCADRLMTIGDELGNTVELHSSGGPGAFGQHASGVFTADRPAQSLSLSIASGNVHLTGYQLRTAISPPVISRFEATPALVASGEVSTLSWLVSDAGAIEINRVGQVDPSGSLVVTPATTTTYTLTASNAGGQSVAELTIGVDVPQLEPVLNEFLASNDDQLFDLDGDPSDWIEIYNPNAFAIDLGGYHLTDDPQDLTKWKVPVPTPVPGNGFLLVFASGKDRDSAGEELHTNFGLNASGEQVILSAVDGATILGEYSFPAQRPNISYGRGTGGGEGYFADPTPGAPNGIPFAGFVADTAFSVDRGFHEAPFTVVISSATPGATIVHTVDGTEPTLQNGVVSPPAGSSVPGRADVEISQTTVLRAAAFKEGLVPTNIDTHTYLFPADILTQPEMDPDVVQAPAYAGEMVPALKAIRTLSIVTDPAHLFDPATGILENTGGRGETWERPVSIEFIDPGGGSEYQGNAGLRMHGNGSRGGAKNSLRLLFRARYGEKKLNYPLFGEEWVTSKFNTVVLRAQGSNSWTSGREEDRRSATFTQDSFAKDLQGAMGHPTAGATYVHLYLNGVYWGLYNPVERPDGSFGEDHFGGDDADYDALNRRFSVEVLSGTKSFWDEMIAHSATLLDSPAEYSLLEEYIALDNLIDYMLMHQFMQSRDGPDDFGHNNMRLVRRNDPAGPFRLYAWDMEYSMLDTFGTRDYSYPYPVYSSTRSGNRDITDSIASVYIRLKDHNPEFRLRYADRAYRHLFNGGVLDVWEASALWQTRAEEIRSAVICESARWGDHRRSVPYTRDVEWLAERDRLLTEFFPNRPAHVRAQLRAHGLYPSIDPPVFSQHGGPVPVDFPLQMSASAGAIHFTTDGSDPREAWTGAVRGAAYTIPIPLGQTQVVKARAFDGAEWSALAEAKFLVGPLADASNLVVSEIHYQPLGSSEDLEFLELFNVSSGTIDLTGVRFTAGISFAFPDGFLLGAGGRILVVNNLAAFEAQHGAGFPVAGEFGSGTDLDNSGERLALVAADGSTIRDFRYDDELPWPTSADQSGYSLVLVNPESLPDHSLVENWRASSTVGGNPGITDSMPFGGTVGADQDRNGIDDLLDHAFGHAPGETGGGLTVSTDGTTIAVSYLRKLAADDVRLHLEWSRDLVSWFSIASGFFPAGRTPAGDGRERVDLLSVPALVPAEGRAFFRVAAEPLPVP